MRNKIFIGGVVLFLFSILIFQCTRRGPIVAQIGRNEVITLKEFKDAFSKGKSNRVLSSYKLSDLQRYLDQMIDQRIKVMAAYEKGLDKDYFVNRKVRPVRDHFLLKRLYEIEIIDPVIKESDIRDFYNHTGKEVEVRAILFRVPFRAKPEVEKKVKARADSVLKLIRAGEDFSALARKYSDDKESAEKGGFLGALLWTRANDPLLRTAFSLKVGQLSDVIKSRRGYTIMKVEGIRKRKREPYEKARRKISEELRKEKRKILRRRANEYIDNVMKENQVQWHDDEIAALLNRLKSVKDPWKNVVQDSINNFSPEEKQKVLVQYKDGKISVQDFQEKLSSFPSYGRVPINDKKRTKELIKQWLITTLLVKKALSKGLDKDPVVVNAVKKAQGKEMVNLLVNRDIVGEVAVTDADLKQYYEENKNKYVEQEKVNVQEILVKDKNLANKIVKLAKAGKDFGKLAKKYTERPGFKKKKGVLGYFRRGRWGIIGEKAFELKVGEIAGPIVMPWGSSQRYSIIKLLGKKPPKQKPFNAVEKQVRHDFINDVRKKREADWLSKKRKELGVKIYTKVLKSAFRKS